MTDIAKLNEGIYFPHITSKSNDLGACEQIVARPYLELLDLMCTIPSQKETRVRSLRILPIVGAAALAEVGLGPVTVAAIPESAAILETEIRDALEAGARFILVLGGSGFGVGNYAPEVVRSIVEVEIPGIAEQIRAHGLANTPLSGLSREVVGVTARDSSGALIISSPGSRGGALDTLEVVTPLLTAIFHQLDEQR